MTVTSWLMLVGNIVASLSGVLGAITNEARCSEQTRRLLFIITGVSFVLGAGFFITGVGMYALAQL